MPSNARSSTCAAAGSKEASPILQIRLCEREFRAEARLVPGSAAAAYKLGVVLMTRGEATAALQELGRANELKSGMPETLLELGRAQASTGATAAAEKSFQQILEQETGSRLAEAAHFQLAQLYRKSGRLAEADQEMKRFQQLRSRLK
jgi:tetratricopeptide (TPR) repeat protein